MDYTHIVWDFNGTLLDDLRPCVEVLNAMLAVRGLPACGEERYKEIFGFPIKSYYEKAGFDFTAESYAVVADEWAALYRNAVAESRLCAGAAEALEFFRAAGAVQTVISATERKMLDSQLTALGIRGYFDETVAADDLFAFGKVALGREWAKRVKPKKALFIGDTTHDFETASAMGADCALVATGHQSTARLQATGASVYGGISELVEALRQN